MPRNGKLKPRIKPSETFESVINIKSKRFIVSTCDKCFRKLLERAIRENDRSIYRDNKTLVHKHNFDIHVSMYGKYNKNYRYIGAYIPYTVPCDFCKGGKKIEDFI